MRGDSTRSTVQVRAFYGSPSSAYSCSSKGVFETETELAIRARAEGTMAAVDISAECRAADRTTRDGNDLVSVVHTIKGGACTDYVCKIREGAFRTKPEDALEQCRVERAKKGGP